jgi:hypothetical protein
VFLYGVLPVAYLCKNFPPLNGLTSFRYVWAGLLLSGDLVGGALWLLTWLELEVPMYDDDYILTGAFKYGSISES